MQNGPAPSAESTESNLQAVGVGVRSEEERGSACMQCRVAGASCSSWGAPPPSLRRWSLVADRAARSCSLLYAKCQRTKDKGQKGRRGPHCRERGGDPAAGYLAYLISPVACAYVLYAISPITVAYRHRGPLVGHRHRLSPVAIADVLALFGVRNSESARGSAHGARRSSRDLAGTRRLRRRRRRGRRAKKKAEGSAGQGLGKGGKQKPKGHAQCM
jgi:hypothetical protein